MRHKNSKRELSFLHKRALVPATFVILAFLALILTLGVSRSNPTGISQQAVSPRLRLFIDSLGMGGGAFEFDMKLLDSLNPDELRFVRNAVFARRGYVFRDTVLSKFFSTFSWYKPDSRGVSQEDQVLAACLNHREKVLRTEWIASPVAELDASVKLNSRGYLFWRGDQIKLDLYGTINDYVRPDCFGVWANLSLNNDTRYFEEPHESFIEGRIDSILGSEILVVVSKGAIFEEDPSVRYDYFFRDTSNIIRNQTFYVQPRLTKPQLLSDGKLVVASEKWDSSNGGCRTLQILESYQFAPGKGFQSTGTPVVVGSGICAG